MADLNGGPATSIDYVETTRNSAIAALEPDVTIASQEASGYPSADGSAVLVVAHGSFVGNMVKGPPNAKVLSGSLLYALIDSSTGFVTDWGLGNSLPDISSLGQLTEAK
jgi:hypothetical protein